MRGDRVDGCMWDCTWCAGFPFICVGTLHMDARRVQRIVLYWYGSIMVTLMGDGRNAWHVVFFTSTRGFTCMIRPLEHGQSGIWAWSGFMTTRQTRP